MDSLAISHLVDKAVYFYQTENPEKAYLFARFAAFETAKNIAAKSNKEAAEIAATIAVARELLKTFIALQFSASMTAQATLENNLVGQYLRQDLIHVSEIEKASEETLACKLIKSRNANINELIKQLEDNYFKQFPATEIKNRFALKDAVHIYPLAFAAALTAFTAARKEASRIKNPVHREVRFKNLIEKRLRCELQDKSPSNWHAVHYAAAATTAIGALFILAGSSLITLPFLGFTLLPAASLFATGGTLAVAGATLGATGTGILARGFFNAAKSPSLLQSNTDKAALALSHQ